jgi:hypothetical protein
VTGGGKTSIGVNDVKFRKSETNGAPCAFRKFAVIKIYPVKDPVCPAADSNSLSSTVQVAPAGRFPLASSPIPGLAEALVVRVNDVPAPVAVRGKKYSISVPDVAVAPPPAEPNGSAVVLARAIPVSKAPSLTANGTSNVVVAGDIEMIVAGPT